jgi:hypothetical protein
MFTMFLSCRSVSAQLNESEDSQGSALTRAGIRLHLTFCRHCTRYLVQMTALRAALRAARTSQVPDDTKGLLCAQFRAWHAGVGKSPSVKPHGR